MVLNNLSGKIETSTFLCASLIIEGHILKSSTGETSELSLWMCLPCLELQNVALQNEIGVQKSARFYFFHSKEARLSDFDKDGAPRISGF